MMGLGVWELVLIFLVVMFFFGAKRIPVIGRFHAPHEGLVDLDVAA